jgi:hypothetical protein
MTAPRIRRQVDEPRLWVWMPNDLGRGRGWLLEQLGERVRPVWLPEQRRWEVARHHLRTLAFALTEKYGTVDVFLEYRATTICDKRCREAVGEDCECSCVGEFHGNITWAGWIEVGDTVLIKPGRQIRERHLRLTREAVRAMLVPSA